MVTTGKIWVDGTRVTDPRTFVHEGQSLEVRANAPRTDRARLSADALVYVDHAVVVVDKPAGVSTVPYESERDTLVDLVHSALRARSHGARKPAAPEVVHRLDKETSGLVMFARSLTAKRQLKEQLRTHDIERRYLAIAHGRLQSQTISSRLVADRGDGFRGSTDDPKLGQLAVTHVRVLRATSQASLVECRLETGRTHQIRIHLFELGHPVIGERVYIRRPHAPPPAPTNVDAPRLMLHAAVLGFRHPSSGEQMRFERPLPADMRALAERLRLV
jgi:23S rRNA pseudouridine1911/1915/1917 synthase